MTAQKYIRRPGFGPDTCSRDCVLVHRRRVDWKPLHPSTLPTYLSAGPSVSYFVSAGLNVGYFVLPGHNTGYFDADADADDEVRAKVRKLCPLNKCLP